MKAGMVGSRGRALLFLEGLGNRGRLKLLRKKKVGAQALGDRTEQRLSQYYLNVLKS